MIRAIIPYQLTFYFFIKRLEILVCGAIIIIINIWYYYLLIKIGDKHGTDTKETTTRKVKRHSSH